jgi:hypothetical protein
MLGAVIMSVKVICAKTGIKFEAESKRTKNHPEIMDWLQVAYRNGWYDEALEAIKTGRANNYTTLEEFETLLEAAQTAARSSNRKLTPQQASIERSRAYAAARLERQQRNDFLRQHGYTWSKSGYADFDEYEEGDASIWELWHLNSRLVEGGEAQALAEIEAGGFQATNTAATTTEANLTEVGEEPVVILPHTPSAAPTIEKIPERISLQEWQSWYKQHLANLVETSVPPVGYGWQEEHQNDWKYLFSVEGSMSSTAISTVLVDDTFTVYKKSYGNAVLYYLTPNLLDAAYRHAFDDTSHSALYLLYRYEWGISGGIYGDDRYLYLIKADGLQKYVNLAKAETHIIDQFGDEKYLPALKKYLIPYILVTSAMRKSDGDFFSYAELQALGQASGIEDSIQGVFKVVGGTASSQPAQLYLKTYKYDGWFSLDVSIVNDILA